MAFNDINAIRRLMESQEQAERSYDKACEEAEKRAKEEDLREWDAIEQAQVDPDTLGCYESDKVGLDDLEEDEIDFSAYGIGEADLGVGPYDGNYPTAHDAAREPLVRIPAAAGRPASDADLAAQNVVQLMTEALKKVGEDLVPVGKTGDRLSFKLADGAAIISTIKNHPQFFDQQWMTDAQICVKVIKHDQPAPSERAVNFSRSGIKDGVMHVVLADQDASFRDFMLFLRE